MFSQDHKKVSLEIHRNINGSIMGIAYRSAHTLNSTNTMKHHCPEQVTRVAGIIKQKPKKRKFYMAIFNSGTLKARLLYFRYTKK